MKFLLNLLAELPLLLLLPAAVILVKFLRRRLASDVLRDLGELKDAKESSKISIQGGRANLAARAAREMSFMNLLSAEQQVAVDRQIKLKIFFGTMAGFVFGFFAFKAGSIAMLLYSFAGACLGYLLAHSSLRRQEQKFKSDIIFFLPVVMERIVMAVQAGLDIIPALKVIDEVEQNSKSTTLSAAEAQADPVTIILRRIVRLCESGLSFQTAVSHVTSLINSQALKHALIHLAVAQKEGGELLFPLRELSDATQLYFQESLEEDIARMPIKATLPLLITFAGLIVTFMAGPLIQIMNVSANPKFVTKAPELQAGSLRREGS